jgi:anti-sigma28 factor (negative regulator of flagellin synthesis)
MDDISLSIPTQERSHYPKDMSQIPDVRQARIAPIQRAIDSNSYVISPEDLADKLLQELHSQPRETRPPTDS